MPPTKPPTMPMRPLIAGNWKMHGLRAEAIERVGALAAHAGDADPGFDIVVCPPATLLGTVADALRGGAVELGAQDCHGAESGAHTGDVSAEMLADAGCRYIIVGHSERRADHAESDAQVRVKAEAAWRAGLIAIVCLGESGAERDSGETLAVVERQLAGSLPPGADPANTVVAYEPIWAIGSGRTPTNRQIAEVHGHLRQCLGAGREGVRLLYGGSVKPSNAGEILALDNVDGALVGGASLDADDFWAICGSLS